VKIFVKFYQLFLPDFLPFLKYLLKGFLSIFPLKVNRAEKAAISCGFKIPVLVVKDWGNS